WDYNSPHDPAYDAYAGHELPGIQTVNDGGQINTYPRWMSVPTGIAPAVGDVNPATGEPNSIYVADEQGPRDYYNDGQGHVTPHGLFNEKDSNLTGVVWKVDVASGRETPIISGLSPDSYTDPASFYRTQDLKVDPKGNIIVAAASTFKVPDDTTSYPSAQFKLLIFNPDYTWKTSKIFPALSGGVDALAVSLFKSDGSRNNGNDVLYAGGIGGKIWEIDQ